MKLSPSFFLFLVICLPSLFLGSLGHSGRPSWATGMWDIAPLDMEKQDVGEGRQSYYLSDQPWSSFDYRRVALGSMEMLCKISTELGLLSGIFLLVVYLWKKVRRCYREVSDGGWMSQMVPDFLGKRPPKPLPFSSCPLPCRFQKRSWTPPASPGTCCQRNSSCKNCELLCKLKANPALMEMYLKHVRHRYWQEDDSGTQGSTKTCEDGEGNKSLFSACQSSRSSDVAPQKPESGGDPARHTIAVLGEDAATGGAGRHSTPE